MACADFNAAMELMDENTKRLVQAELDRLTLLGEEKEEAAKQQYREERDHDSSEKVIKKPATYEVGESIRAYVNSWEIYKNLLNLSDEIACMSFITYLKPVTQNRLKVLGLLEERDWKLFTEGVIKALAKPKSKMALRYQLRNMKQKPNELLTDFIGKLMLLAEQAFGDNEKAEKEDALKIALCAGIMSDSIAVKIIKNDSWDFREALDYAIKKETSLSARKSMQQMQVSEEMSILEVNQERNEETVPSDSGTPTGESGAFTLEDLESDQKGSQEL